MENLYYESAFRIIGLPASATVEEINERLAAIKELTEKDIEKQYLEMFRHDIPWMEMTLPSLEAIKKAADKLSDANERYKERAFWYHCRTDEDKEAVELLCRGKIEDAIEVWMTAWEKSSAINASSAHNLAVLFHTRALAAPRGDVLASEDISAAARWWGRIVDNGRLGEIIADGEDENTDKFVLENASAKISKIVQGTLASKSLSIAVEEPQGMRMYPTPIRYDDYEYAGIYVPYNSRADIHVALERATDYVRANNRRRAEHEIERAIEACEDKSDEDVIRNGWHRLALRLITRNLKPVHKEPPVFFVSGLGIKLTSQKVIDPATSSFECYRQFCVFYLPIITLGKYRVRENRDGSLDFLGQMPQGARAIIVLQFTLFILALLFFGSTHFGTLNLRGPSDLVKIGGGGDLRIGSKVYTVKDRKEMQRSSVDRKSALSFLEREIPRLENEKNNLLNNEIPKYEKELKELENSSDKEAVMQEENNLKVFLNNANNKQKEISYQLIYAKNLKDELVRLEAEMEKENERKKYSVFK